VAYDEDLADRVRELIGGESGLTEQKMFGGLAFLIDGHTAVTVSSKGGLMVRVDPASSDALIERTNAQPVVMRGREMRGWVRVAPADVPTKRKLAPWVARGTGSARRLTPGGAD
jgi:TfoX N-terminal domain